MTAPRRALVVVDVQQEYFDGVLQIQAPSREATLANVVAALDVAREAGLPVVVVQHELPEGAPVFAVGSESWSLHPEVERRLDPSWKRATKDKGSVFAGTDVAQWLAERDVDTVTVVGYMTNNCDLATAVGAEELGLNAEILSDATGAIHLANEAGQVSADQLHQTLLVLLHSNFAAVATTEAWVAAVREATSLMVRSLHAAADLVNSFKQVSVDQAAVVARFAPSSHEASVGEMAPMTTVPQLRRALSRYQFGSEAPATGGGDSQGGAVTAPPDGTTP